VRGELRKFSERKLHDLQERWRRSGGFHLLQSALQPLWVLACSTIVKYSQQEGFLQSAVASGTLNPQLGGPVITTFQLPPPGVPHV